MCCSYVLVRCCTMAGAVVILTSYIHHALAPVLQSLHTAGRLIPALTIPMCHIHPAAVAKHLTVAVLLQWAPDGQQVRLPVAHMVCNQTPPIGEDPSLMTFREVETLFHEFGHALQHMLTQQQEGLVAGIRGVEWDAVELPSQFMENWCYDRPTLFSFAKHYSTGEPLPEELYEKLKAAKCASHALVPGRSRWLLALLAPPL